MRLASFVSLSEKASVTISRQRKSTLPGSLEVASLKDTPAPDFTKLLADAVASLPVPETPELPDIGAMVSEAVAAIPAPQDGKSVTVDDITPVLQELVSNAVAEIPVPKDGKDFDPAMLKQAVEEAVSEAVAAIPVPRDGKSVTTEDVQPMIQELVSASIPDLPDVKSLVNEAIAALPAAEPGKDGENGRDALALEILPFIDEEKATHVAAMPRITAACGALTRKPMVCVAGSVLLMVWRVLIFSNLSSVASP